MNAKKIASMIALPIAFFAVQSVAWADSVTLKATLNGASQIPPVTTDATGTATVTVDTVTKIATYTVTYTGLSDTPKAAHIHGPASATSNAGVAVPFAVGPSPFSGSVSLTDAQLADLLAGRDYVNVHTPAHPGGEIRGMLAK